MTKFISFILMLILSSPAFSSQIIEKEIQKKFDNLVALEYKIIDNFKKPRIRLCITANELKTFDQLLEESEKNFRELIAILERQDLRRSTFIDISKEMTPYFLDRFVQHLGERHSYNICKRKMT